MKPSRAARSAASLRGVVVLVCFVSAAQAQSLQFGPLRFGMTFAEVRAATPGIDWTDVPPAIAGRPQTEIKAVGVISFAGMPFDAVVLHAAGDRYRIGFSHAEPVANAAACEAKGIALVADIEGRVGPFEWPVKLIGGEQLIRVGKESLAQVNGWTSRFQPVPRDRFAAPSTTGFGLRSRRSIGEDLDRIEMNVKADLEGQTCNLELVVRRNAF